MDFIAAVKTVLVQKYATFAGRARRSEYWWYALFYTIVYLILLLADPSQTLVGIFCLATLIPSIAVGVRRLHDIDMSGWWYLIMLIPLVNLVFWIFIGVKTGTAGPNRFGEDPLT